LADVIARDSHLAFLVSDHFDQIPAGEKRLSEVIRALRLV
jgi:hypothetical protein